MGASYVFGPQKGLTETMVEEYEYGIMQFGQLVERGLGQKLMHIPGSGAAGGLGFALIALGGEIHSGAKMVADTIKLDEAMLDADLVITGEGQSDEQTLYGKAPGYIAEQAKKMGKTVILLSGSLKGDLVTLNQHFQGCFSIISRPMPLSECIEDASKLIYETTQQIIYFYNHLK